MKNKYDIAAFIWPSYTGDEPRTRIFWPEGYGEWQTVKAMTDKGYEGCRWPRKPLWGYCNEADPRVMEMQIKTALDYGVNVFIYDWYWFDDRPFLENCLNDGFLQAANCRDMKFFLMWANHHADYLWDKRNAGEVNEIIWQGTVSPSVFDAICDRTIEKYFKLDNYYKIDNCPVYMVFEPSNFLQSFPSTSACRDAVLRFREKTSAAGFAGLHLQCVFWDGRAVPLLPENDPCSGMAMPEVLQYVGFDSFTNYNWGGSVPLDGDYAGITDNYLKKLDTYQSLPLPFYPNLTLGWDNNVRFKCFMRGVVRNNTPEQIERACLALREALDARLDDGTLRAPLLTVNSWNEWTETSYLEPDDLYGYGYLEAIRSVFTKE